VFYYIGKIKKGFNMKIESLKLSLEFAKDILSKEEYVATIAAIDLAVISIKMNDHIVQSDNQLIENEFQNKCDEFLYFLQDD
jgi:hypothetical protein